MTYILHHEAPARFGTPSLVKSASRTALNTLEAWARATTSIIPTIARIPAAISQAFATAYVAPFQPSRSANDPSDPQNF